MPTVGLSVLLLTMLAIVGCGDTGGTNGHGGSGGTGGGGGAGGEIGMRPVGPSDLRAEGTSESTIELSWTDNADDETGVRIERSANPDNGFAQVGTTSENSETHTDSGLSPATDYFYRVLAYNSAGNSDYSEIASGRTRNAALSPPAAPLNVTAEFIASLGGRVDVRWTDNSDDEAGFRIERSCTAPGGGYEQRGTAVADAILYQDLPLEPGTTCYYRVLSYNSAGESAYSNVASVDIPADRFGLTVHESVSGNGIVVQTDPTTGEVINCGTTCMATYDEGTTVTLVAQPIGPDTFFAAWQGCDSADGAVCTVTMNGLREVTVVFVSSISITGPPSPDQNGEYTLRWICNSAFCASITNSYFVIQEDRDALFENPIQLTVPQNPQYPNLGARGFTERADGEYCYRVSFQAWGNWSLPRCVTVARTPVTLPKTGQRASYASHDDGWLEKGVTWPNPRFTDNQDGTITDDLTGLMWLSDGNCIASEYPGFDTFNTAGDGAVAWTHAYAFLSGVNDGTYSSCASSYSDWRLPNVNEMLSLANYGQEDTRAWLATQGFSNVAGAFWYWTSSAAPDPTYVMRASIGGGTGINSRGTNYALEVGVWSVRTVSTERRQVWQTGQTSCYDGSGTEIGCAGTGQDGETRTGVAWPSPRFANNGDGTITDNLTGLIWLADADCMNTYYPSLSSVDGEVYWQEAIDFVTGINDEIYSACAAGHDDWRLPNTTELRSLLDFQTPLTDYAQSVGISNLGNVGYWSSTSLYHPTGYIFAKTVYPGTSMAAYSIKDSEFQREHVWPVRGGD